MKKLTELTKAQERDPHELSDYFARNPCMLFDHQTCAMLKKWIEEKNPAVPYALSALKTLETPEDKARYDAYVGYFINNESKLIDEDGNDVAYKDLPEAILEKNEEGEPLWDDDALRQYFLDTKTKYIIDTESNYKGSLYAIQYLKNPSEKLPPFLLHFLNQQKPQILKEDGEISQARIVKEYWGLYSHGACGDIYRALLETFQKIPPLPDKRQSPASLLSKSMHKVVFVEMVDKATQCDDLSAEASSKDVVTNNP